MKQLFASLLIAAAATISQGQSTPNVSYTAECASLKEALAQISKQTGKKLQAGDDLAAEPVVLRFNAVPLQEVEEKLAQVLSADWVPADKGLILTRTEGTKERLLNARFERMRDSWQAELDRRAKARAKDLNLDTIATNRLVQDIAAYVARAKAGHPWNYLEELAIVSRTADGRLEDDILASIGASTLAGIGQGRFVFSNRPTPTQLPIALSPERVDEYVKEHNALVEAINAAIPSIEDNTQAAMSVRGLLTPITDNQLTILISDRADPTFNMAQFEFLVYDKSGDQIYANFQYVSDLEQHYTQLKAESISAGTGTPSLRASPLTVELAQRQRAADQGKALRPPSPKALEYLSRPDLHDPLDLGFAENIFAVAERADENVVATGVDWAGDAGLPADETGSLQIPYFKFLLQVRPKVGIVEKDGWLLGTPEDPLYATEQRFDREAMATFLQSVHEQGYARIEDWAGLAATSQIDCSGEANTYRKLLDGPSRNSRYVDWSAYRLFGLLSDDQKAKLAVGGTIEFNTLDSDERACLTKLLYQSSGSARLKVEHPRTQARPDDGNADGDAELGGILGEPTVRVPNGISLSSPFSMRETQTDQFYANIEPGPGQNAAAMTEMAIDPYSVASMLAQQQGASANPDSHITSLVFAAKRTVTFDLGVAGNVVLEIAIDEEPKPSEPIPVDQLKDRLPAEVWERLSRMISGIQRSLNRNPSNQSFGSPPPPATAR